MALKKTLTDNANAPASYWRIAGLQVHDWEGIFVIILLGYVDEATRRAVNENGTPKYRALTQWPVRLTAEQIAENFPTGMKAAELPDAVALYEFIKSLPDFAGAKDA